MRIRRQSVLTFSNLLSAALDCLSLLHQPSPSLVQLLEPGFNEQSIRLSLHVQGRPSGLLQAVHEDQDLGTASNSHNGTGQLQVAYLGFLLSKQGLPCLQRRKTSLQLLRRLAMPVFRFSDCLIQGCFPGLSAAAALTSNGQGM